MEYPVKKYSDFIEEFNEELKEEFCNSKEFDRFLFDKWEEYKEQYEDEVFEDGN